MIFLLVIAALAAYFVLPFLCGVLVGVLVTLAPGVKFKLLISRLFIATPFRLISPEAYRCVLEEVTWRVNARYGPKELRPLYQRLLDITT